MKRILIVLAVSSLVVMGLSFSVQNDRLRHHLDHAQSAWGEAVTNELDAIQKAEWTATELNKSLDREKDEMSRGMRAITVLLKALDACAGSNHSMPDADWKDLHQNIDALLAYADGTNATVKLKPVVIQAGEFVYGSGPLPASPTNVFLTELSVTLSNVVGIVYDHDKACCAIKYDGGLREFHSWMAPFIVLSNEVRVASWSPTAQDRDDLQREIQEMIASVDPKTGLPTNETAHLKMREAK